MITTLRLRNISEISETQKFPTQSLVEQSLFTYELMSSISKNKAAAGGSFRAVAPVAVWGMARLLRGGRVLCGKVPNNAYSQGSQELIASAGACSPGSLADAQGSAVACPPPHASLRPCLICALH